jgi:hypothetical protein
MSRERRRFPRYPVDFPVQVRVPAHSSDAGVFRAQASNLSRISMELGCDAELVSALQRQQQLPYACNLEFLLPSHSHAFMLGAQVITQRRVSRSHYVLVLLLKHQDAQQAALLASLLGAQMGAGLD